jgi:hydrogenase nickel incorporation protein HypB
MMHSNHHRIGQWLRDRSLTEHSGAMGMLAVLRTGLPSLPMLGPLRAHRFGHDHETVDIDAADGDVLAAFREQAADLHHDLVHERGIFMVELLGATGAGKTRLLEELLDRIPEDERVGVIVGDVAGDDDAKRLRAKGVTVTTVNTGKECHLDPALVDDAIDAFDLSDLDRLYIENVGNMVCPADFPLGAQARVLVVSTTEGDDVVRKHPLLFQACDAAVLNKTDVANAVDADVDRMVADVEGIAPEMPVFETSAKTGTGVQNLADFLETVGAQPHGATEGSEPGAPHRQQGLDSTADHRED